MIGVVFSKIEIVKLEGKDQRIPKSGPEYREESQKQATLGTNYYYGQYVTTKPVITIILTYI